MLKIESNKLTVCIDELGAQMSSIYLKEDGTERQQKMDMHTLRKC